MSSNLKNRIAILTGGGDAPGLNGVIHAATKVLHSNGIPLLGICDGFEGVFHNRTMELDPEKVEGIIQKAGTILGTSNRSGIEGREAEFAQKLKALNIGTIIAVGGDGTFRGISRVLPYGIQLVGVPKTIDNDLSGTDFCFGFDTACSVVATAMDDLRTTADSHRRLIVLETMGRTAGWIALGGGLTGVADGILIPEFGIDFEALVKFITERQKIRRSIILAVSEGAAIRGESPSVKLRVEGSPEPERLGGVGEMLARRLETRINQECRSVVLGHLQRGAKPTTTDRFLSLSMGAMAAEAVLKGQFQMMAAYRDGITKLVPLSDAKPEPKLVDLQHRWVSLARSLGIYL